MFVALQSLGGHAQEHLGRHALGLFPGQAAQHAAIRQPLQKQAGIGPAATGHGAGSTH